MSKIFLGKTYRAVKASVLDEETDPIEVLCRQATTEALKGVSRVIVDHELYRGRKDAFEDDIRPKKSKVMPREGPSWRTVFDSLEYKVKVDQDAETKVGHFRFYLPSVLSPQILIVIQSLRRDPRRKKLLVLFHGNSALQGYLQEFLEDNGNCVMRPLSLSSRVMRDFVDHVVQQGSLSTVGDLELWFGKLNTRGKLGSIVINMAEKEIHALYKGQRVRGGEREENETEVPLGIMNVLYQNITRETTIKFEDLSLVKVKCMLFSITSEGRVNFGDLMTPMRKQMLEESSDISSDKPQDKSSADFPDDRISIWFYLDRLLEAL